MSTTNLTNEQVVREAYRTAEVKDTKAFVSLFADDGYFWDVSAGMKYYGNDIGKTVDVYAEAFPDMHRELLKFFIKDDENVVIVELTLNGTHKGPLALPFGSIPATNWSVSHRSWPRAQSANASRGPRDAATPDRTPANREPYPRRERPTFRAPQPGG